MKKARFTEDQTVTILREADKAPVPEGSTMAGGPLMKRIRLARIEWFARLLHRHGMRLFRLLLVCIAVYPGTAASQIAPSASERARYGGLLAAADRGDLAEIHRLLSVGSNLNIRDGHARTALHIAAYRGHHAVMRALAGGGANPNALEADRYDIVTIAAVADDLATLRVALEIGASAKNVTSRYDGTALIAAAHLGHETVVSELIRAGAPLDHVNNLGWTALIESIVLGNGARRHVATLRALVEAGANVNLPDRNGATPLALARSRGYTEMAGILQRAGAR